MDELDRVITADDDRSHTPEGGDGWHETWSLAFFDEGSGLYGLATGSIHPLRQTGSASVALFSNQRPVYILDAPKVALADCDPASGRIGPVAFTCNQPMSSWTIAVDSPQLSGQLSWTSLHDAYDWAWGPDTSSRHFEQPGHVVGRLTAGGTAFQVSGYGQRERAWGSADPAKIRSAWSSRVLFADDHLEHASVINVAGQDHLFGYVIRGGEAHLIERLDINTAYAYTGGPPLSTDLRAWDGERLLSDHQIRVLSVIPRFDVTDGLETQQFSTFSKWIGVGSSAAGFLDHLWTGPREVQDHIAISGNNGRWVR